MMTSFDRTSVHLQTYDMNDIFRTPELISVARKLTLHPDSGMNRFMDYYHPISLVRSIDAVAIFAFYPEMLLKNVIGWCLFTREDDEFEFKRQDRQEACAQVYVEYEYRMKGVGKQLLDLAAQMAQPDVLRVYSWSNRPFFDKVMQEHPHVQSIT